MSSKLSNPVRGIETPDNLPDSKAGRSCSRISAATATAGCAVSVPVELARALEIKNRPGLQCPEDIRIRIANIRSRVESSRSTGFLRRGGGQQTSPADSGANSARKPGTYRVSSFGSVASDASSDRRNPNRVTSFESISSYSGGGGGGAKNHSQNRPSPYHQKYKPSNIVPTLIRQETVNRFAQLSESDESTFILGDIEESAGAVTPSAGGFMKFKSKFKKDAKNDDELDDRILGHIRAKINKFSAQNYKKVLGFLRQNMDCEEKVFLEHFMALIFSKAAEEDTFVALYAQLLADLTPEFPHLKDEMLILFKSYLEIFQDVSGKTDTSVHDYTGFLDAQIRKNHRRGYSLFIAEIATRGLIEEKDLLNTTLAIANALIINSAEAEQKLLVEELADCLTNILGISRKMLSAFTELNEMLINLQKLVQDKGHPGLSYKARFAIMDCLGL